MTTSTKPLGEWHRIDDPEHPAPKDGTAILLFIGGEFSAHVARFEILQEPPNAGCGVWVMGETVGRSKVILSIIPTHWAHLPPLPEPPRP